MWQCLAVILVVTFLNNTDATEFYHNTFWIGNSHSHALFPSPALLLAQDVSCMGHQGVLEGRWSGHGG